VRPRGPYHRQGARQACAASSDFASASGSSRGSCVWIGWRGVLEAVPGVETDGSADGATVGRTRCRPDSARRLYAWYPGRRRRTPATRSRTPDPYNAVVHPDEPGHCASVCVPGRSRRRVFRCDTCSTERRGMLAWAFHRISGVAIWAFVLLHVSTSGSWAPTRPLRRCPAVLCQPCRPHRRDPPGAALLYHALNGLRIVVMDFWPATTISISSSGTQAGRVRGRRPPGRLHHPSPDLAGAS